MRIIRNVEQSSQSGPAETFTGRVRIDGRFSADAPARVGAAIVTFEPGARTAWHKHPAGQLLIVMAGVGFVQRQGGAKETVYSGDSVWFEPGEKHWHGASVERAMSHVAIAEWVDGRSTDWMEHVSDAEYNA